jgi:acetyl esterase/lipase
VDGRGPVLGVACALNRWRKPGSFSKIPALLVSELPFIVAYLLIASTVLALADGDLDSPGGAAGAAVALLALAGLGLVVRRALSAHAALRNTGRPRRPWGRILRAPFFPGRRDVVRVRGLAYGDGPDRTLDVYHRRDRPARVPVLLHLHGGGFYSGSKAREARPLIRHLTSRILASVSDARAFVERVRAVSSRPVSYAELPGAHHDFDMFESIRSAAVSQAVEQFTASVS